MRIALAVSVLVISGLGLGSALLFMVGTVQWAQVLLVATTVGGFLITLTQQFLHSRKGE